MKRALTKDRIEATDALAQITEQAAIRDDQKKVHSMVDRIAPKTRLSKVAITRKDGKLCLDKEEEGERWSEHVVETFEAHVVYGLFPDLPEYRKEADLTQVGSGRSRIPAYAIAAKNRI